MGLMIPRLTCKYRLISIEYDVAIVPDLKFVWDMITLLFISTIWPTNTLLYVGTHSNSIIVSALPGKKSIVVLNIIDQQGWCLMLVTDVGDEMCWRQLWDVGDSFGRFCHQHPLFFNISVWHQHPKIVSKIKSPTSTRDNIYVASLALESLMLVTVKERWWQK